MKRIEKDIKTGEYKPIYLVYGPEDFLRQKIKQSFRDALAGSDELNYTYREGPGTDEDEIRILAGTVPFFAEKRLILLENTGWAKKGAEGLVSDLDALPDSTVLVFIEREADEKSPLFKAARERGICVSCEPPSETDLLRSLKKSFEQEGYEIEPDALEMFLARCGGNMNTIACEKEKLLAYTLDTKKIRREDVETITHQSLSDRIFDMVDAMAAGRPREAFRLYADLKALKEPNGRIMGMITTQVGRLFVLRELDEKGLSMKDMQTATGYNYYAVKNSLPRCRALSSREWEKKWRRCLAYDTAHRTGRMDETLAVEMALIEVSLR